jgi:hypothetical protein
MKMTISLQNSQARGSDLMSDAAKGTIGQPGWRVRLTEMFRLRPNTLQRVLLYVAASIWFMVYALSHQRNYQDAWILDGILWPFIGLILLFLYVVSVEKDNRVVTLLSAWMILVITLIPSLKYEQPYGSSTDATEHYLMVESLMTDGKILEDHIYASIPAIHAWLASFGLTSGLSEERTIQLGLPLTGALMPLLIYWWLHATNIPEDIAKYTIAVSCLSAFPHFLPNGTGFTLLPLVMLLAVLFIREYGTSRGKNQFALTIVAVIGLLQITFWHSTTPLLLPLVLGGITLTPLFNWVLHGLKKRPNLGISFARMSLLAIVLFFGYRMLRNDRIFQVIVTMVFELFSTSEAVHAAAPPKLFQVTLVDAAVTTWLLRGRFILLSALSVGGILVLWRKRRQLDAVLPFYLYVILIITVLFPLLAGAFVTGISYGRFMVLLFAFAPFLVGPFMWWSHKLLMNMIRPRVLAWLASATLIVLIITLAIVDFFPLQPIVPKLQDRESGESKDYLLWVHSVNSAYQKNMMSFAESYAPPQSHFAMDLLGQRQYIRYFGENAGLRRRLYLPLRLREEVDPREVDLFLLHWPGRAGGLSETIELRSVSRIQELRETPNWGLVYDNGESFILWVRR